MRTLLITGGIGSGKSLVCRILSEQGVPVYDSDSRAKALYESDLQLKRGVVELFGERILNSSGSIDRKALSAVVFSDREALAALERVVHPAVYRDFEAFVGAHSDSPIVAFESAIALQRGYPEGIFDEVVYVDAPLELRLGRAARRDGTTPEEILSRVRCQQDLSSDARITYRILNCGTPEELRSLVAALIGNDAQLKCGRLERSKI